VWRRHLKPGTEHSPGRGAAEAAEP
jgi:hypothetical protein